MAAQSLRFFSERVMTMAKATAAKHEKDIGRRGNQKKKSAPKRVFREILFPTEPTSIDPALIDRAIEYAMSRRKKS
jgi:hypothetical protein